MTSVGKILVFMNLLLSLVTSGMIVLVFTSRTKWMNEYEKMKNISLVAEAHIKAQKVGGEQDVTSQNSQLQAKDRTIQSVADKLKEVTTNYEREKNEKEVERAEKVKLVASEKVMAAELKAQAEDRARLDAKDKEKQAKILDLQKDYNDAVLLATNNKIEADSRGQQSRRLLDRVEELERNNTQLTNKLNSQGGGLGASSYPLTSPPPVPAPRDVYGTVTAASQSGLIVVNIGSDSGISAGNKLVVYRNDVNKPIYLGEMTVTRTEPKQAVGQFYPKAFAKPEERVPKNNDVVSTSLGSR